MPIPVDFWDPELYSTDDRRRDECVRTVQRYYERELLKRHITYDRAVFRNRPPYKGPKSKLQSPNSNHSLLLITHCSEDGDTLDRGYFAITELEEDDVDEYAEQAYKYDSEESSDRVDHKLGQGGFSTIWMAHDFQTGRDVALKVMESGDSGKHESYMQDEICQSVQDTSHLVVSLATFSLSGSNTSHRVLVLPLMGPHLDSFHVLEKYSMPTRMSAVRQLLEALESLHEGGIVHCDLNNANCMWGVAPIHDLTRAAKYEVLGQPLKLSMSDLNLWKPGERVKPLVVPDDMRTESLYLGDFGQAMKLGCERTQEGRPPLRYCSPDRLHHRSPSFACDMWSYMCIFAQLYIGLTPFPTWGKGGVIASMVGTLGPLPEQWKGSYLWVEESQDMWYNLNTKPWSESLEKKIDRMRPDCDPVEKKHALSVLTRGFSYYPEKRPSATQLLRDASFRAIMDNYGC